MNTFIFTVADVYKDCDFLNDCGLEFQFQSNFGPNDSGFCDAMTGQQVIAPGDRFKVIIETDEELARLLSCNSKQLTHIS